MDTVFEPESCAHWQRVPSSRNGPLSSFAPLLWAGAATSGWHEQDWAYYTVVYFRWLLVPNASTTAMWFVLLNLARIVPSASSSKLASKTC